MGRERKLGGGLGMSGHSDLGARLFGECRDDPTVGKGQGWGWVSELGRGHWESRPGKGHPEFRKKKGTPRCWMGTLGQGPQV